MNKIATNLSLKVIILGGLLCVWGSAPVSANGFNAGKIIDDVVFADRSRMNATEIQDFLNAKVPVCDTWGQQPYAGTTRAQYAASRGVSTPFTCLKDYTENGKRASQIIYDVAQKYSINPQVLIVLLQKEQGLITDDWPWPIQYRSATGYGCPDTADCASQYYGFTNQVDWAARMFRAIMNNSPDWYTPYELGSNYIQYSPDPNCGGSTVYIQNRATQALYNYTPYQPNQAALDAGWGTAHCGAYGNRNFYLYFNSWFGSVYSDQASIRESVRVSTALTVSPNGSLDEKQVYTARFSLRNSSNKKVDVGWMLVSVRDKAGFNLDFPIKYISIAPNSTYTYEASRTFEWTGNMTAYINGNLTQGIGWSTTEPAQDSGVAKNATFRVGSDVVLGNGGIKVEKLSADTFRATSTFVNHTSDSQDIGWFMVSARTPFGQNADFPAQNIVVPANSSVTYSQTRTFDMTDLGTFKFFASLNDTSPGGYGWTTSYPMNANIWTKRSDTYRNGPNIIQSEPLSVSVNNTGEATASVTFKNQSTTSEYLGWVIISTRRSTDNINYDFQPKELSLKPGETKQMQFKQQFVRGGNYTSSLIFNRPNGWSSTYAPPASSSVSRTATFTLDYPIEQIGETSITSLGNRRTAKLTLRNTSGVSLNVGWLIVTIRDQQGNNLDFPGIQGILAPGETKTFATTRDLLPNTYTKGSTANHNLYGWGRTFKATMPESSVLTLN